MIDGFAYVVLSLTYERTVAAIFREGLYDLPARPLRGGCVHAVALDQGRQAASCSLFVRG